MEDVKGQCSGWVLCLVAFTCCNIKVQIYHEVISARRGGLIGMKQSNEYIWWDYNLNVLVHCRAAKLSQRGVVRPVSGGEMFSLPRYMILMNINETKKN